ncbi:putative translation initiation factor protein [Daldinia childiae]|uniref:putative translation initiation factor protein n=1 Tax=Daldinia childiae TaxID=326645 RepID=UPI001445A5EC|nr:putative translation initiation factor protein [Daldinia childiae]KAF3063645.1 putative translation initiation factor protein [Daldinia childiae]
MAQPRCLASSSPARALHRVLVSDLLSRSRTTSLTSRTTSSYLLPPRLFSCSHLITNTNTTTLPPPLPIPRQQTRSLSTTAILRRIDLSQKRPTNGKIPYDYVRVVGPPPDNALSPAQPIGTVLASLNPKTHTLVMRRHMPHRRQRGLQSRRARSRAARARKAVDTKELEFSWGIEPHDMGHKLRRLRQFLDLGLNVEVILAKKRHAKPVSIEAAEAVLEAVRSALTLVDGAKEVRKMDGKVGGVVRLYFEGPSEKKRRKKKDLEQKGKEEESG